MQFKIIIEKISKNLLNIIDKAGNFLSNKINRIKYLSKKISHLLPILLVIIIISIPLDFFFMQKSNYIEKPLWIAIPVTILSLVAIPFIGFFLYWITKELIKSFQQIDEENKQKYFIKIFFLLLIYTGFFLAYLFAAYFGIASIISSILNLTKKKYLSSIASITNTIIVAYTLLTSVIVKFFTDIYIKKMK